MFYAGLQSVSQDALEAAMLDGASARQCLRYVTLPHLMPLLVFVSTLAAAEQQGVLLTDNFRIVDTGRGDPLGPGEQRQQPMTPDEMAALRVWTVPEMARRTVRFHDLRWSQHGLPDSALPGCGGQLAAVIGLDMAQDRDVQSPVANAHGLSIEWLRLPSGGSVSRHRLHEKQALIAKAGCIDIAVQTTKGMVGYTTVSTNPAWDTFSLPPSCWRTLTGAAIKQVLRVVAAAGRCPGVLALSLEEEDR